MIAIPAIDLRGGACVQLVGGSPDREQVRLERPHDVAHAFLSAGFKRLHIVDLDAALGQGSNRPIVLDLLGACACDLQVGGGIRADEDADTFLAAGASRVIVGTRALEDDAWLATLSGARAGKIVVAADVRDRSIVTHGWTRTLPRNILDTVSALNTLPLGGLLVTAVEREGLMQGCDVALMQEVVARAAFPVYAAGGVGSLGDLRSLAACGVAGVVIGMALYTGALSPRLVAEEFIT
ncbi:MAG: 1-(5-phosphoribosyl)-5-[(5-phosphoribosylamino)methylideneamino] imidazole-4-carboxamide isomerase [Gemmatimonadaceae bacterium]